MPSLNFRSMCQKLRGLKTQLRKVPTDTDMVAGWYDVPDSTYDLLLKLLDLNPLTRITAEEALTHTFFEDVQANMWKAESILYLPDIIKWWLTDLCYYLDLKFVCKPRCERWNQ